ncbi:MAG: thioredoxin family protein [bacterium]|nr:thioredoxin family protein [bacterium]
MTRRSPRYARLLVAALIFFLPGFLASPLAAEEPVSFSVQSDPSEVRAGETVTVWIDAALTADWHIYSTTTPPGGPYPTEITLQNTPEFQQVGPALQPPPIKEHDPNFDMVVEYYGGSVRFGIRAKVAENSAVGPTSLQGSILYMLCNATSCLPPQTWDFEVPIQVTKGNARAQYITHLLPPTPPPAPDLEPLDGTGSIADVDRAREQGLAAFLYLAFTMGLLSLLTPCVFPMVPITVSFFTKQENGTRSESIVKSLVYCGGIVVTFTGLGLLLSATLGASGAALFAANPWINLFITALFIAFALSLFGLFEIRLPSGLLTRLSQVQGGGYGAILVMGFTFSLTSFTCTAPFVGTLLVLTSQGTWMWPILGMLAFSAAFSLPFFFLSLFPQGLSALPKSGGWLNSVKVVMGFLELAAALKFLSNVDLVWNWGLLSRELFLSIWIAIFVLCGVYLLGKIRLPHDTPTDTVGPLRLLSSLASFAFGFYLLTGLFGAPLGELDAFFPPYGNKGTALTQTSEELTWKQDYGAALAEAKATGKPIFVDFTGYACTNCRWMEANMFTKPEVRALLERHVRVQLYTDGREEVHERNRIFQQERFGTVALPYYAILSSQDQFLAGFPGLTRDQQHFVRFLQKGLNERAQATTPPKPNDGI